MIIRPSACYHLAMKARMVIGVTGPIASGKDEVCKLLKKRGYLIIDADKVGHDVLERDQEVRKGILKTFGTGVLDKDEISRIKLGKIVFSDKKLLKKLDRIIHPAIFKVIKKQLRASSSKSVCINAAVLYEIGLDKLADKVLTISASKKRRLERLMNKGLTKEEAQMRVRSQRDIVFKKNRRDLSLINDGTIKELRGKVLGLMETHRI